MSKGQKPYQKYIILSTPRSGSNYLIHLLHDHPAIRSFGELFQPNFYIDNPGRTVFDTTGIFFLYKKLRNTFPVFFLHYLVFRPYPKNIKAVGFKIFYEHAHIDNLQAVWTFLQHLSGLKIIHLQRKNLLRTYVSLQLAQQTGDFISFSDKPSMSTVRLTLTYTQCVRYFQKIEAYRHSYEQFFHTHQILTVYYEDLVQNKKQSLNQIQAFLNIDIRPLDCAVQKQNKRRMRDIITNYDSLKKQFARSRWKNFFD